MKQSLLVLILILHLTRLVEAQEKLCNHDELTLEDQIVLNSRYSIELNKDAYSYIKRILDVAELPMNFVVQKIEKANNAYAYMDSYGTRYILYDNVFLNSLNSDTTNTELITVLAHEIGHHLAGHSLAIDNFIKLDSCSYWCNYKHPKFDKIKKTEHCSDYLKNRRTKETEADVFAGYIMARLKYDKQKVKNTFIQISTNKDDTYSTHPSRNKRLTSIDLGYSIENEKISGLTDILKRIRVNTLQFSDRQHQIVKRSQLIDKIKSYATFKATSIVNEKTPFSLSIGAFSHGEKKGKIDTDKLYLEPFGSNITIRDLNVKSVENLFHLKIEDEILYLIMIRNEKEKIIYTSIFNEEKISFVEISNLFATIYEALIKEALSNER